MSIRVVIAEDEPLARRTLLEFIAFEPDLTVVGEAADGKEAVLLIDDLEPELVFLDVQLPEFSGLDVLRRIEHEPEIIFTTAFDRYAIAAFELEALDYLLKPFGRERFSAAVDRARKRLRQGSDPSISTRPEAGLVEGESLTRFFVRHRGDILPIRVEDVSRIQAADDYVEIHAGGKAHLAQMTVAELERRLDRSLFRRVHRSHIINLEHIVSLQPYDERRLLVHLRDGSKVLASRAGSRELKGLIT